MVYLQRWHGWCHMKMLPSRRVLCRSYNHAPYHFMQSHIRKVHACLAVTCHLHCRQNDRGLLRAIAITRELNGYRNMSQHRKLTLEKKYLPPLLHLSSPLPPPFDHESDALTTELFSSPSPTACVCVCVCVCVFTCECVCIIAGLCIQPARQHSHILIHKHTK